MAVLREKPADAATLYFFFGPTSLCTDTSSPKKKLAGERDFLFSREGVAVHRLGPTGHGSSLLCVTDNNVVWRMQGCFKNLSNFNLFTGNFHYACNCTGVPVIPSITGDQWVQLWQRGKDSKVLTVPFSYNKDNIVIVFHQFDWIECPCWYICGSMSLRKCPSCMFLLDECYFLC